MTFLLFNLILLLIIIVLLGILSMVWPPDSPWAPWWRTNAVIADAVCRLANIGKKDTLYELGCGDATMLLVAATKYNARGFGVEIDPLRAFIAKMRVSFSGLSNVIAISNKNFFDIDVSNASVVFVYLVPKALQRLKPKLQKELKPGTRIVSFRYEMELPLVKFDKKNNLRLYTI